MTMSQAGAVSMKNAPLSPDGGAGSPPQTVCILMPVYNECHRVREAVAQVLDAPLPPGLCLKLVIVDDGSKDGTIDILRSLVEEHPDTITLLEHTRNQGKGAAIRTAINAAEGDFAIIQDADLEYDPRDYPTLLQPLLEGNADAVFGSRFTSRTQRKVLYFWHTVMNRILTLMSNIFTNLNLTDMETGYKAFRLDILKSIPLRCNRFGMEPELTAKVAKRRLSVYEVPISYHGRSYEEGKKITAWDGVKAVATIFYYWLVDDLYNEQYGHAILHRLSNTNRFNRWMADTIKPYVGQRVLEIGSGMGNLTRQFLPRKEFTATDIDPLHLQYLRHRYSRYPQVSVRQLNLTSVNDFASVRGQFDTVICLNVLEHVEDDHAGLRNMYESLQPGGRALVLVPRGMWLYGSLDTVLGHYRRYTPEELTGKARAAGFEVVDMLGFNRAAVPGWFFNAVLLRRKHFGALQLKVFDALVGVIKHVDRWLPWHGISVIGVLQRPLADAGRQPLREVA
jgi:glycosyltransferase involved in cell wall biosynthesis